MVPYILSFLWGILILLSFIGWGALINRLLFSKYRIDWGQRAAWGMAFCILAGGILNLTWTISRATILALLASGLLWLLFDRLKRRPLDSEKFYKSIYNLKKDRVFAIVVSLVCLLALWQYCGSVYSHYFNFHDDFHAYLVFPNKMLQLGSMGPDPFSERRLVTSLGGQSFLHTLILSMLSEKNLNIIDPGLAILITLGLLSAHSKNKGLSKRNTAFILLFLLLIPLPKINTTALATAIVLFISFFRTLDWEGLHPDRFMANAFIAALLASAICALKSTLIVPCAILFVLSYLFYLKNSKVKRGAIYEFLIAACLLFIFLLPWMISMYQSSGTLLYPFLGKGYHGSAQQAFPLHWAEVTIFKLPEMLRIYFGYIYTISLLLLIYAGFVLKRGGLTGRAAPFSLSISAALGSLAILIAFGGHNPFYSLPFTVSAIIILMINILHGILAAKDKVKLANYAQLCICLLTAGVIIKSGWQILQTQYSNYMLNIDIGLKNSHIISSEEAAKYRKMQTSIPQGKTVLARLAKPFLLDFTRNKIFIADWPGGASPPPGLPAFQGAEALAGYLSSPSIRYIAYSYGNEANFPKSIFSYRLTHKSLFVRTSARHTFDFQDNLRELGNTRKRIYDDGENFVVDLLSRRD